MIMKLVEASNMDNLLELRNVCMFVLSLAVFFRIEEVLHVKKGDIAFHDGYVQGVVSESLNKDSCSDRILRLC